MFCAEPRPSFPLQDFTEWTGRVFPGSEVLPNPEILGCLQNTRRAFSAGFERGAWFTVLAEEDLVVSADVLEYLAWAASAYEGDSEVACVCAHAKESKAKDPNLVTRQSWFNPLVCGTWRDRWETLLDPTWGRWNEGVEGNQAWDNNLRIVLRREGKHSIFPALSRVSHIGEISTIYSLVTSEYMYRQSVCGCFAPDHQVTGFREVPFDSVPGLLV